MNKIKLKIKNVIKKYLLKSKFFKAEIDELNKLRQMKSTLGFPPGHYYSPIPNLEEIKESEEIIFSDKFINGVDLNIDYQFQLLKKISTNYINYPYQYNNYNKENKYRYIKKDASFYRYSDNVFLFLVMNFYKPKKIIEIGSGHSSASMLDTNEHFLNNSINFTFIEPDPERLNSILNESDKDTCDIRADKVQKQNISLFKELNENDILFIDSSHVSKTGSDLNHIFFEILPKLNPGVLIHFHDIFYPFELPKHWVMDYKFFWNENYLLRAFLMNNESYEIILFNSLLQKEKRDWFEKEMPECLKGPEPPASIWIRKIK